MGTIKQGILGGFSGKVGTVVGSSWKGISYMRGRAQSVRNPRTEGQMEQRSKFAQVLELLAVSPKVCKNRFCREIKKEDNCSCNYPLHFSYFSELSFYKFSYSRTRF